jgi:hypothetical protein
MLAVNLLTREFVKQFLVNSVTYLALAGETQLLFISSGGKLL